MGAIEAFPGMAAPMPAVARILARYDRAQLAAFIEIAIDLADTFDGDAEAEPGAWPEDLRAVDQTHQPEDAEAAGDEADAAWLEWTSIDATRQRQGLCRADSDGHEDDEEDDHGEEDDPAGQCDEDEINTYTVGAGPWDQSEWPGCPISDPGEMWQQTSNVPMPEAVTLDHNVFNDRRTSLGIVNLQTSYRTDDQGVRSADSGNLHRSTSIGNPRTGTPV